MKKHIIISLLLLALALLVVGGVVLYKHYMVDTTIQTEESTIIEEPAIEPDDTTMTSIEVPECHEVTHGAIKFEDIEFDSRMLGKWQHTTNTTWYRVYTTEPAEDGFCWGREWDTADDIFEEDLIPYGNGWFMWKKDGDYVIELHMTDNRGASIPFEYKVLNINDTELNFKEIQDAQKQQFIKCN